MGNRNFGMLRSRMQEFVRQNKSINRRFAKVYEIFSGEVDLGRTGA